MSFIDEAKFLVRAGDGGNGCVSFRREKFVPKGGPDGGDGGAGGSVYLVASARLTSLLDFKYRSHFIAEKGVPGRGRKMHGRNGEDCLVKVPVGSVIRDAESNEILADLVHDGQRFLAARGGMGGKGNVHFASATNRAPRTATKGKPGEEFWLRIELKLLADVGLIGLPNAGKSTLLTRLTAATPKVADYPFTTLSPQLGVLFLPGQGSCTIADIPGLIEDAHRGAGLGHTFLRHVERTRLLIQVIDAAPLAGDPLEQYHMLERELGLYQQDLIQRPRLVVLNKIDLLAGPAEDAGAETAGTSLPELERRFARANIPVIPVSALGGQGLDKLVEVIARHLVQPAASEEDDDPEAGL
ncbi:GTPase ObgE [Desulfurivibrio sp. C05AmB]|jgi:GTPase|uniref:GTPase ObgE n=1 Tax=Desulfurivibrio sp. C05AmB TaxID=3374371 RepID=UPI00376F2FF2